MRPLAGGAPRIAALLVLAAAVSGCAPTVPAAAPSPTQGDRLPDGVSVVLIQHRADVAVRELQVRVRNDREEPLTVGDVMLDDPRFEGTAVRAVQRVSTLAAGASVDVRVALPPMDCAATDEGTSSVTLHLVLEGTDVVARGTAPDALDVLSGIHRRECLGERLAAVADVAITSFDEGAEGRPGTLHLLATRRGPGTAQLEAVESTPLLTFDETAATSHRLDTAIGEGETRIDIPLVPQRCDPHVVQEDKRGTVFTFTVRVGEETGEIDLAAPAEMKARMLSWVARWCGFGG